MGAQSRLKGLGEYQKAREFERGKYCERREFSFERGANPKNIPMTIPRDIEFHIEDIDELGYRFGQRECKAEYGSPSYRKGLQEHSLRQGLWLSRECTNRFQG